MNNIQKYLSNSLLATAVLLVSASPSWAQAPQNAAMGFSVLGGTNVTCTSGVVTGDIGVAPGSAVPYTNTGCVISGATPPATNTAAVQARADFLSAYAALQLQTSSCTPVTGNLSGLNLSPGVYCLDAVAKEGTLTLTGPANGVWVFLVNGALTSTNFSVAMAGGAVPCNVYWAPTAAATLTTSAFKGSILAGDPVGGSITVTGGSVAGNLLANVAVTMTDASVIGCDTLSGSTVKEHNKCNQGVGNGSEGCDPGHSDQHHSSNDENGGIPGNPGRKGGNK